MCACIMRIWFSSLILPTRAKWGCIFNVLSHFGNLFCHPLSTIIWDPRSFSQPKLHQIQSNLKTQSTSHFLVTNTIYSLISFLFPPFSCLIVHCNLFRNLFNLLQKLNLACSFQAHPTVTVPTDPTFLDVNCLFWQEFFSCVFVSTRRTQFTHTCMYFVVKMIP